MNKNILKYIVIALLGASVAPGAIAAGNCGMNSNKPCDPPKMSYKEKVNLNSNKPQAAKSLSGVNASELKMKAPVPKTSQKEPAK